MPNCGSRPPAPQLFVLLLTRKQLSPDLPSPVLCLLCLLRRWTATL